MSILTLNDVLIVFKAAGELQILGYPKLIIKNKKNTNERIT